MLGYGAFLTSVVQFLLMAFTVFWMIKGRHDASREAGERSRRQLSKLSSVLPGGKEGRKRRRKRSPLNPPRLPRPNPPPRCPPKRRSSCAKSATSSRPRRARNSSGEAQGVLRASGTAYGFPKGFPSAGSRQRSPEAPQERSGALRRSFKHDERRPASNRVPFHLSAVSARMTSSGASFASNGADALSCARLGRFIGGIRALARYRPGSRRSDPVLRSPQSPPTSPKEERAPPKKNPLTCAPEAGAASGRDRY